MTDYSRIVGSMSMDEKAALSRMLLKSQPVWIPQKGPQLEAYNCQADVLFYGGSAGGGKTDLLLGLALTQHQNSLLMRRAGTQFRGIIRRMTEMLGTRDGYSGTGGSKQWNYEGKLIEFGSCPDLGDEEKHQGIPHDFKGFDEITHFLEYQFRFLITWLRSVDPTQRCRVVATGNPPTSSEGSWVRDYWAPWLDPRCPVRAHPGDLLYYVTNPETGEDTMVEGPEPVQLGQELVTPTSRTFIPSSVEDNVFLLATNYKTQLQSLPEPLRSQMLHGDFQAGTEDNAMQVIPTDWIEAAMDRWRPLEEAQPGMMSSVGVDVSRGGRDKSAISRRHGNWYDRLIRPEKPVPRIGEVIPYGPILGAEILTHRRDVCPIHVDAIGVGSSVVDWLVDQAVQVLPFTGSEKSAFTDKTGTFHFYNLRAEIYWLLREALDPGNDPQQYPPIALPPDQELLADLSCATYIVKPGNIILVESKDDIRKRLGRSTDAGDGVLYASIHTTPREIQVARSRHTKPRVKRSLPQS